MAKPIKRFHKDGSFNYQMRITIDGQTHNLTCDEDALGVKWGNWTENRRIKAVEEWGALKKKEIKEGLATGRKATKRFKEYSEELIERDIELGNLKPQTATEYRAFLGKHAYPIIGNRKLQDITPDMLTKVFLGMVKSGYADGTIRQVRIAMSRVFTNAVKNGYLQFNPIQRSENAKGIRKVQEKRKLTTEEIHQLLIASDEEKMVNKVCVQILIYTGCRRGEACGMRWKDVDLNTGVWNVSNNLTTNNNTPIVSTPKTGNRQIVLPTELVALLKEWRMEQFSNFGIDPDRYVLSNGIKQFINPKSIQVIIDRLTKRTGVERFTPHELRHSFISNLVDGGENFKAIADYVGNSPKMVMDVYAHTNTADMQRISDNIYADLKAVK